MLVSALRPYSPDGGLNGFPSALTSLAAMPTPSPHRLQPGLPGFLVRREKTFKFDDFVRMNNLHFTPKLLQIHCHSHSLSLSDLLNLNVNLNDLGVSLQERFYSAFQFHIGIILLFCFLPHSYLIRFATLAFVPHRRTRSGQTPSLPVVPQGLKDFTPTPGVPLTSPGPKPSSIP